MLIGFVLRRAFIDDGFLITQRHRSRHPEIRMTCLAYTDDVALACSLVEAERAVCRLAEKGEKVWLRLNIVLHVGGTSSEPPLLLPDGSTISLQTFQIPGNLGDGS